MHFLATIHSALGRFRCSVALLALAALAPASLSAHGTLLAPMSRVYRVYQNNPENPTGAWAKAALQVSDKNAFYTWNQVSQNISSHDYRSVIPDGHIASGGNPLYYGIDLPRTDWPATPVAPGNYQLYFLLTAVHEPSYFDVYLTKEGYDPSKPLTWDGMEKIGAQLSYWKEDYSHWRINVTLPPRTGKQVLWLIWQRQDPVGEAFFAASDLIFDGSVTENVIVSTPDPTVPTNPNNPTNPNTPTNPPTSSEVTPPAAVQTQLGDVRLDFSSDSAWVGGYQAQIKVTNLGAKPLENWKVSFTGSFIVTSLWDGRYLCESTGLHTVAGPASAPTLAPGASATFGFVVAGPLVAPANFQVSGVTTITPDPDPVVPPPASVATLKTELRFDSTWGSGFNATLRITNTGKSAVDGWTAAFEAPFVITSAWNGTYKKVGTAHTLSAASWNSHIDAGQYVEVSFGGTGAATPVTDIVVKTNP